MFTQKVMHQKDCSMLWMCVYTVLNLCKLPFESVETLQQEIVDIKVSEQLYG
jgi:hypothetical protein